MVIGGYRVGPLLKKTLREVSDDNVTTLSAAAAFNFFSSLIPLLLFLTALLTIVGDRRQMAAWVAGQLATVLPASEVAGIEHIITTILTSNSAPGLLSLGIVLAAWSGSNIFGTLMGALNTAYDVTETRSWITQQLIRLSAFGLGVVVILISTIVFLRGPTIANWVGGVVHLSAAFLWTWKICQYPIVLVGVVALVFVTLYMLPNVTPHKGQVLVASVVATVLWGVATLVFRLYVAHFPPNPAYGILGVIMILLGWMYYTMLVILVVGELASELHHGTGAVAPEQGAVYVGRVVTGSGPGSPSVKRRA